MYKMEYVTYQIILTTFYLFLIRGKIFGEGYAIQFNFKIVMNYQVSKVKQNRIKLITKYGASEERVEYVSIIITRFIFNGII